MGSGGIVVIDILGHDALEVGLAEDDHVVASQCLVSGALCLVDTPHQSEIPNPQYSPESRVVRFLSPPR